MGQIEEHISGHVSLHQVSVGGVHSAREQDSSIGGGASNVCLGVVHMEEEVQDRVQEEVGREEQGEGETHGKEQCEEQRVNRRSINHSSWMTMNMGVMRTNTFLSQRGGTHHSACALRKRKMTCEVYLCTHPVG